jgi:wobble nucleotide-excising tRNase
MSFDPDKPRYIPVKGTKFVRDTMSGALLNTDIDELNGYKIRKKLRQKENEEKNNMKKKIDNLESDISDIKSMLLQLIDLGSKDGN